MFLVNNHASNFTSEKKISVVKKIFSKTLHSFSVLLILFLSSGTNANAITLAAGNNPTFADNNGNISGVTESSSNDDYVLQNGAITFAVEDDESYSIGKIDIEGDQAGTITEMAITSTNQTAAQNLTVTETITSTHAGAHTIAVNAFLTIADASTETAGTLNFTVANSIGIVFAGTGDSVVMAGKLM